MSSSSGRTHLELRLDAASGGGASVGRDDDGRVVFADGGLPGETVSVELTDEKPRYARGRVIQVLTAAPGRRPPPCPTAQDGCGGCDLAHATPDLQRAMKEQVVVDSLTRIGRIESVPPVSHRRTLESRYRTTLRLAVADGRAGHRRRWSHDVVPASRCLVAHPLAEELIVEGRWGDVSEVTIRVSDATSERLAIVDGDPAAISVPGDVTIVSVGELEDGAVVAITERAGGRQWRVSALSFFQAGPAAASALVEAVSAGAGDPSGATLVDAYAGIGLFSGSVGVAAERVVAIERSPSSAADARANLGPDADVVESAVERWAPEPADIVIADPARSGLGPRGVDVLVATGAARFVLVSCDTGSLGRDAGLLAAEGYRIEGVELVDAFPDTSHIETVLTMVR